MSVNNKLKNIFVNTFGIDGDIITENTIAADIPEWDSLGHLRLFMAIESDFGKSFPMEKVADAKSVKDIIILLEG